MLPFSIQFRSGEPVYEQVLYAVKKAMMSGNLVPGDRFPSVRVLSQELKINPNTAHKVVAMLTTEGLLTVQPGIGTVVGEGLPGTAIDKTALLNDEVERLVVEARKLGLSQDQIIAAVNKHWRKISPNS